MHPAERLASYLDGELDVTASAAVERDLAHDPELREVLARLRRADVALSGLPQAEPPDGFEERLEAQLAAILDREITGPVETAGDELALRRGRRARGGALAAAAAGLVGLAVVGGTLLGQLDTRGDGDSAAMVADGAQPEAHLVPGTEAAPGAVADAAADGPLVVAEERALDDALLDEVATSGPLASLAERALDSPSGREVALRFQAALGLEGLDGVQRSQADVPTRDGRALSGRQLEVLGRCLAQVVESSRHVIPAHVEFGQSGDEDALVVGLLTIDPGTAAYTRVETWLIDANTCQVLRFTQH